MLQYIDNLHNGHPQRPVRSILDSHDGSAPLVRGRGWCRPL